ncbi:hypothetical protein [Bacillus andreraoultii]|uniref:hypothetical protein n=1 Tax=Bacillus andreraoultii TaxID=1499685 RepID=UPI000A7CC5F7|nr:hypothetical protein [Bacillus andreraoultii]
MYRSTLDFSKISKALEATYSQLQEEQGNTMAYVEIKKAEERLQQAIQYTLSTPTIR